MLQNLYSICQFLLTKWSFLVHSTTGYASYIHPSHNSGMGLDDDEVALGKINLM